MLSSHDIGLQIFRPAPFAVALCEQGVKMMEEAKKWPDLYEALGLNVYDGPQKITEKIQELAEVVNRSPGWGRRYMLEAGRAVLLDQGKRSGYDAAAPPPLRCTTDPATGRAVVSLLGPGGSSSFPDEVGCRAWVWFDNGAGVVQDDLAFGRGRLLKPKTPPKIFDLASAPLGSRAFCHS